MKDVRPDDAILKERIVDFYDVYHQERVRKPDQRLLRKFWSYFKGKVLEIGAGRLLWNPPAKSEYVTIEISSQAAGYCLTSGVLSVHGDGEILPFTDTAFDTVACHDVLEHITDPVRLISEMCRTAQSRVVVAGPNYVGARYYMGGLDRTLPLRFLHFLRGPGRGCHRLEDVHLSFDSDWQPDADAITAANSWWVMQRLKKAGFDRVKLETWPQWLVHLNKVPILSCLGPYMVIVGERNVENE